MRIFSLFCLAVVCISCTKIGADGARGETGPKGETGPIGPQGPTGAQGEKGDKGDTGIEGPKGDTGPSGDRGMDGAQGLPGLPGLQGAAGPQGIQGTPGVAGMNGASGVNGVDGVNAGALMRYPDGGVAGTFLGDWVYVRAAKCLVPFPNFGGMMLRTSASPSFYAPNGSFYPEEVVWTTQNCSGTPYNRQGWVYNGVTGREQDRLVGKCAMAWLPNSNNFNRFFKLANPVQMIQAAIGSHYMRITVNDTTTLACVAIPSATNETLYVLEEVPADFFQALGELEGWSFE